MPLLALQEKIEAELNSNPVLELSEDQPDTHEPTESPDESNDTIEQKELVVDEGSDNADDFNRLESISNDYDDYFEQSAPPRQKINTEASDKKLQALQNTAALQISLHEHLTDQWSLIEADEKVKKAGSLIIDYLDEKGFLTVRVEQLHNEEKYGFGMDHLYEALMLVQKLEPTGVGARDVQECLLIQMAQYPDDMTFEMDLVEEHFQDLLENRFPQIAKKMNCSLERINQAVHNMSKLDTSPGLQIGRNDNHPITADVIVTENADGSGYEVSLADANLPNLQVNKFYSKMAKNKTVDQKTRSFLQQNIHSAQWLMEAIAQRKNTLLKVATAVVRHQQEFFDKGQMHLKPLPMATIADEVGIHIATVSRAVAGKYLQCSQGVLPLRGFFSGGTESDDGSMTSWNAVKAKLQQIIDHEDKSKPFSDDQLKDKLAEAGIPNIARRTVAKYRKLLNIPAARFRKKY